METAKLASKLGVTENALRMYLKRNDIEVQGSHLTDGQIQTICEGYCAPNPRRKPETIKAAMELLNKEQVMQEVTQPTQHPSPSNTNAKPSVGVGGRVFLAAVFVCALMWQMHHTALLEHSISPFVGKWGIALATLFAFSVQFTALLLTMHKAKKRFLIGAAVCELGINLLVYFPNLFLAKILLSIIPAVVIYSYSELFIGGKDV